MSLVFWKEKFTSATSNLKLLHDPICIKFLLVLNKLAVQSWKVTAHITKSSYFYPSSKTGYNTRKNIFGFMMDLWFVHPPK